MSKTIYSNGEIQDKNQETENSVTIVNSYEEMIQEFHTRDLLWLILVKHLEKSRKTIAAGTAENWMKNMRMQYNTWSGNM